MYYVAMRFTLILFVSILVSSCSTVYIKGPLDIESDLIAEIEGVWVGGPEEIIIFIKNYGENKVRLGILDWKSDGNESRFDLDQRDVVLSHDISAFSPRRESLDGGLIFGRDDKYDSEVDEDYFVFAKYLLSDNSLIVWAPNPDIFKELVASGEIAGKVNLREYAGDDISLDIRASEIISRISSGSRGEQPSMFMHQDPTIFRKIAPLPGNLR